MSSTKRGAVRPEHDVFPTPAWAVHRFLEACNLPGGKWLEPAAGEGAIIKAVNEVKTDIEWNAFEIRQEPMLKLASIANTAAWNDDFLNSIPSNIPIYKKWDVLITNPPFAAAQDFVEKSIQLSPVVVMLLRVNFLSSKKRAPWFQRIGTPDIYVLPNRPDFSGGGGDSCEYGWFVWDDRKGEGPKLKGSIQMLDLTPKAVRDSQKLKKT